MNNEPPSANLCPSEIFAIAFYKWYNKKPLSLKLMDEINSHIDFEKGELSCETCHHNAVSYLNATHNICVETSNGNNAPCDQYHSSWTPIIED